MKLSQKRYEQEAARQELITDIGAALLRSFAILSGLVMAVALGYGVVWAGALIGGWL